MVKSIDKSPDYSLKYNKVALDTMVFIYIFEENKKYLDYLTKLFLQIENGEILGVTSIITRLEILVKPKRVNMFDLVEKYTASLDFYPNLTTVNLDKDVCDIASSIRAQYDIKTPDAIQIGTAILQKCDVFITNDISLKKIKDIDILVLDEIVS